MTLLLACLRLLLAVLEFVEEFPWPWRRRAS